MSINQVQISRALSSVLRVTETETAVEVKRPVTNVVTLTAQGSQGPAGGSAFVHQQVAPATIWIINHNLGYKPSVELLDSGSQEIDGEVSHSSDNQLVVRLNPASAGLARLI